LIGGKMTLSNNKNADLNLLKLNGHPLLKNYPGNVDDISWNFLSKEKYMQIEDILTREVTLFDPFVVEDFYPQEMFDELVSILTSKQLDKIDFSNQMNKWEQGAVIPQKFYDYAIEKVKKLIGTEDIKLAYNMYAHHQITSEGRVPKLPLHIDWAPGAYMIDLHIGGNRDWGFVGRYTNFITKPNQAVICQPQFDYHYRPSWNSTDPNEFYQAFFIHLVNKNHWCWKKLKPGVDRPKEIEDLYVFGNDFRDTPDFMNFQSQRSSIFQKLYLNTLKDFDAPEIPWSEIPNEEDTNIHSRKGITPLIEKENK
jgi:hypothetical protein